MNTTMNHVKDVDTAFLCDHNDVGLCSIQEELGLGWDDDDNEHGQSYKVA